MTDRLHAIDLFCGAGGASMGCHQAGFEMTGVDNRPQPRYPFRFIEADALDYVAKHGHEYDAVFASPPCQGYSHATRHLHDGSAPLLIDLTRRALAETGLPWVIENVPGAPLLSPITLCGAMFGLKTYRHRIFESNVLLFQPAHRKHLVSIAPHGVRGSRKWNPNGWCSVFGGNTPVAIASAAMGIDWMTGAELSQAIPPAFAHFVARQVIAALGGRKAA